MLGLRIQARAFTQSALSAKEARQGVALNLEAVFYSLAGRERQRDCRESRASITDTRFVSNLRLWGRERGLLLDLPNDARNFAAFRPLILRANKGSGGNR